MRGEFALIDRLCRGLKASRRTILGPGDDCAIVARSRWPSVITVDALIEGRHFKIGWGTPEQIGARAVLVNLSDLAAMGARPSHCVVNLAVRTGLSDRFLERLYDGLRRAARDASMDLVGGNVVGADKLAITVTVVGELTGPALRRDQAHVDDDIYVTGTLGDAALGWRVLDGSLTVSNHRNRTWLVSRCLQPSPRMSAGQRLAQLKPTPAAIDISDGLAQDLGHILERSALGADIEVNSIPLSSAYRSVAGGDRSLALTGGEDYELIFTLRPGFDEATLKRRLGGVSVGWIGRIVARRGLRILRAGKPARIPQARLRGWDQLRDL